jgi:DNA-binding transcriptional LysR family regulator
MPFYGQIGSKMKQPLDVNALADFNLVVSHGGFGAAARASRRPKATLSRHIRALEESLGLRLIDRDSRAFRLTDEGTLLCARTEGPLAELVEAAAALTHDRGPPRGKLRVNSPLMFGHLAMGSIAAGFALRFPDIQLEVTVEDRHVDLIDEGYDVVIRINPRPDSQLVGRCFHRDELLLVAPADLARPLDAETPVPLVAGSSAPVLQKRGLIDGNSELQVTLKTVLRLPSPLMVRDAVLAGAGVGILPRMLVARSLKDGFVQDWGCLIDGQIELWALHASRRLTSARIAAFLDFLAGEMPTFFALKA